jgi:hypothetical protein
MLEKQKGGWTHEYVVTDQEWKKQTIFWSLSLSVSQMTMDMFYL